MDWGFFKRHPYITGATVVVGGVIFFLILKNGGGNFAVSGSSGLSGTDNTLAYDLQNHSIDASLEAHNNETAAAIQIASFGASNTADAIAAKKTVDLATLASTDDANQLSFEAFKYGTQTALQSHALDLASQSEQVAEYYNDQQRQRSFDSEGRSLDYQLSYKQIQQNGDIIQQLLGSVIGATNQPISSQQVAVGPSSLSAPSLPSSSGSNSGSYVPISTGNPENDAFANDSAQAHIAQDSMYDSIQSKFVNDVQSGTLIPNTDAYNSALDYAANRSGVVGQSAERAKIAQELAA